MQVSENTLKNKIFIEFNVFHPFNNRYSSPVVRIVVRWNGPNERPLLKRTSIRFRGDNPLFARVIPPIRTSANAASVPSRTRFGVRLAKMILVPEVFRIFALDWGVNPTVSNRTGPPPGDVLRHSWSCRVILMTQAAREPKEMP